MKYTILMSAHVASYIEVEANDGDEAYDLATDAFFDLKINACNVHDREFEFHIPASKV